MGKHRQTRPQRVGRQLTVGALAVGLVAASVGAAYSQDGSRLAAARSAAAAATPVSSVTQLTAFNALTGPLTVPPDLVPPRGNVLSSVYTARGVQVYTCTSGSWRFTEPAATLTGVLARPFRPTTAVHFRGPSWQSAEDGSLVTATAVTSSPVPGSIAQLLLKAATTRGPGVFGAVTYVQRLGTTGGTPPSGACTEGVSAGVPYGAVYRFFVAAAG